MATSERHPAVLPARPGGMDLPGASAVVGEIQTGTLTARQAVENSLEMIERHNGSLNAVIVLDADAARARADELDANRATGHFNGPLDGLPMTIKEAFDLEGMPTSWGLPEFQDSIAQQDSTVASRLKKAGAIILGKTNLPGGMEDWETDNPVYGATRNPWDLSRSAGGSSGGGAAAVASGMVPADIGSDTGGSIRIPAHYCGLYGIKPTWNLTSTRGHCLGDDLRGQDMNTAGPICREPQDIGLIMSAIMGAEEIDATGWTVQLPQPDDRPLSSYRIAVLLDHAECPVDSSYSEVMHCFIDELRRLGVAVDSTAIPNVDFVRATDVMNLLVRSEGATRLSQEKFDAELAIAAHEANQSERKIHRRRNSQGRTISHRDWLLLHEERLRIRQEWQRFFEQYDAFLTPVASTSAPPLRVGSGILERTIIVNGAEMPMLNQHFWAAMSVLPYIPSLTIPIGQTGSGMPVGIDMVGPAFHDLQLVALATRIHQVLGAF